MSDAELAAIVKVYGNKLGDIEYLPFLNDCDVLKYVINDPYSGAKSTYVKVYTDFSGSPQVKQLV